MNCGIYCLKEYLKLYEIEIDFNYDKQMISMLEIVNLLKEKNVDVKCGNSILTDRDSMQKAIDCGYVVFLEKRGESLEKDVREELIKADFCGLKVLGIILES